MKRRLLLFILFLSAAASAAQAGALYDELSRAGQVKVFVAVPTDPSGKSGLDPAAFRQEIQDSLRARKSIRFQVVESEADATFKVESEILGFHFSETDPVDMLIGAGMAAMDAAKQEHFSSMEAVMTVRAVSGAVRWTDKVRASVTDATMTEAESRPKTLKRAAEMFVRQAFGKK